MARKRAQPLNAVVPVAKQQTNGGDKPEPKVELMAIPAALLLAAETITAKAPKDRDDLQGVLLHLKDTGVARIVAADGFRYFIGSFECKPAPSWLKGGIMVSREALKARVNMLVKVAETQIVVLAYAKGASTLTMMDVNRTMEFKVPCADVKELPDYEQNIQVKTFTDMNDEAGMTVRPEWEPVGFNSRHMKDVGDIARILEAGMPKEVREKNGMTIRVFDQGNVNAPRIFDFQGWDGAILIVGAMALPTAQLPLLTAKVLAPAVRGTVAALRAHATRWIDAAAEATTDEQREACLAKAQGFQERVAAVLARAPEKTALPAPEAAEKLEGPETVEPDRPLTRGERSAETKRKRAAARAATTVH